MSEWRYPTLVKRAVAVFEKADPATQHAGKHWYDEAEREMRRIAAQGPHGFGPARAAGVFAALSPRTQWSVNLKGAYAMAIAAAIGLDAPPQVGLGIGRERAWQIAKHGARPKDVLSGPKVTAFWRNLSGDENAVTIDIWMARAIREPEATIARRYPLLQRAYQAAAKECDVTPRAMQAIVWLHARGWRPDDPAGYGSPVPSEA